ncbi:beta-aspartyl-peptidase [Clostridium tyrobutyricum]|uniref:Isoaspartyl dipeptidase n=1 Tax=Clostridium tyrobutyricum DIVETGP TaxID=1408889 RepID=W6N4K5_CLOTY|nr:beta-aspartyl-peptidase [Clostridium tyrobutyricum]AND84504.1 isoaspartyl dipeptidase [Clostridium tyrobutyricum]ANP69116.1 beta-aspartyl-peptidase [Clostridium tyrobutyricum]MBV4434896.1 beta-aspartyl-peptidase [Clostridium tyrobutyricum]MBV4449670.1 beta-aspartyl-peptidase [Clostridium tyrobutyricum]QNB66531.1 beta-aspartyl-peptidase [Clostridium tyrobutyricum]
MLLIKNVDIYAPEPLGKKNIFASFDKIAYISPRIDLPKRNFPEITTIDAEGLIAVPGLIDMHMHFDGAGGEGGFNTRTPEMVLTNFTMSGITTCVGLLGTDGITRSMGSLVAKAQSLEEEGLTTYCWTGCYEVPTRTLTDTVRGDLVLVDKIIGAGEIAISDHRSSCPSYSDLIHIASETRVGGLLSGKCGILYMHLGDGKRGLEPLFNIIDNSEIPPENLLPTHVNRNSLLVKQSIEYVKTGGYIDITTGIKNEGDSAVSATDLYIKLLKENICPYNVTMSSDAGGSMPIFDDNGKLLKLTVGLPTTNMETIKELYQRGISIENSLIPLTSSPSSLLKFKNKGHIKEGFDADILLLDNDLNIAYVISKGNIMVSNYKPVKYGTFEYNK